MTPTSYMSQAPGRCFGICTKPVPAESALPVTELGRSNSDFLLEFAAEAGHINISHTYTDLINGHACIKKHVLCFGQTQFPEIIGKILIEFLFEKITHVGDTDLEFICEYGNGKIGRGIALLQNLHYLGSMHGGIGILRLKGGKEFIHIPGNFSPLFLIRTAAA